MGMCINRGLILAQLSSPVSDHQTSVLAMQVLAASNHWILLELLVELERGKPLFI
jgi:hypothetical protein